MEKKEIIGHKSNCISQCKIPIYFAKKKKKKPTFSILQIHFYKIPTSVCLSYHLFYLTNHFPHFFIIYLKPSLSLSLSLSLHSQLSQTLSPFPIWNSSFHSRSLINPSTNPPRLKLADSQAPIHKHRSTTSTDPPQLKLANP